MNEIKFLLTISRTILKIFLEKNPTEVSNARYSTLFTNSVDVKVFSL